LLSSRTPSVVSNADRTGDAGRLMILPGAGGVSRSSNRLDQSGAAGAALAAIMRRAYRGMSADQIRIPHQFFSLQSTSLWGSALAMN